MSSLGDVDQRTPAKRRRIALSCIDCRKRKLKCDREYPSCGRCRENGHSARCTYDPDAVDEVFSRRSPVVQQSSESILPPARLAIANNIVHYQQQQPDGVLAHPEGSQSSAAAMQSRIEQLENRIIGLERLMTASHHSEPPSDTHGASMFHSNGNASQQRPRKEWMVFKGKHCKTGFYGASHPQSYLSQVRYPIIVYGWY